MMLRDDILYVIFYKKEESMGQYIVIEPDPRFTGVNSPTNVNVLGFIISEDSYDDPLKNAEKAAALATVRLCITSSRIYCIDMQKAHPSIKALARGRQL